MGSTRYPATETVEIIELMERSHLPAKRTVDKSASHDCVGVIALCFIQIISL